MDAHYRGLFQAEQRKHKQQGRQRQQQDEDDDDMTPQFPLPMRRGTMPARVQVSRSGLVKCTMWRGKPGQRSGVPVM